MRSGINLLPGGNAGQRPTLTTGGRFPPTHGRTPPYVPVITATNRAIPR